MARGYSIRFKDGKVSKVSGARTPAEMKEATEFGEGFLKLFEVRRESESTTSPAIGPTSPSESLTPGCSATTKKARRPR